MLPEKIWMLLDGVGCDDVYQFLSVDDDASLEDLRAAAEKKYTSIHNQGARNDVARAGAELAGLCRSEVFKSAHSKAAYDREAARRGAMSRGEPPPAIPWYLNAADKALPVLLNAADKALPTLASSARFIFEFYKARTFQTPFLWGFINVALGVALLFAGTSLGELPLGPVGPLLGLPLVLVAFIMTIYGMLLLIAAFLFGWFVYLGNRVKRIFLPLQVLRCQSCDIQATRSRFARGGDFECPACGTDLPPYVP